MLSSSNPSPLIWNDGPHPLAAARHRAASRALTGTGIRPLCSVHTHRCAAQAERRHYRLADRQRMRMASTARNALGMWWWTPLRFWGQELDLEAGATTRTLNAEGCRAVKGPERPRRWPLAALTRPPPPQWPGDQTRRTDWRVCVSQLRVAHLQSRGFASPCGERTIATDWQRA